MWRDRTNLFISYRQSYSHHPAKKTTAPSNRYSDAPTNNVSEDRRGLLSAGAYDDSNDVVIEMDLLPPRWLDIQDEVNHILSTIAAQTKRLDTLHQKHILPGFEDEAVKKREEKDIEALTSEITRGFGSCQRLIKRIDGMVEESRKSSGGGGGKGEEQMAKNLKISLATRVGEVSASFRKKQSAYLKKLQSMNGFASPLDRSSTPLNNAQNPYTTPSLMDSETDRLQSQSALRNAQAQTQMQRNTTADATILQREREIESIAQGVIDLANIFQELQSMVIDQGSMLDRIDYNVERTLADVKGADKELTVATGYQRRSVKRKIMLLLVILIAGMFILLGLKISSKSSTPAPAPAPIEPPPAVIGNPPNIVDTPTLRRKRSVSPGEVIVRSRSRRDWRRRKRDPSMIF